MKKAMAVAVALVCLPLVIYGAEPIVEREAKSDVSVELRYYAPKLKFEARGLKNSFQQAGLGNFRDTFGIKNSHAPEYMVNWKNWSLDYIRIREDGRNLNKSIDRADLNLDYVALNYRKNFHQSDTHEAYWLGGLRYYQFYAAVYFGHPQMKINNFSNKQKQWLPAVGVGGKWYLDSEKKWDIRSELSGGTLGKWGHFYDWDVGLHYVSSPHLGWNVGYRVLDLKIRDGEHEFFAENGSISSVYKLSGWYGGVEYRF